MAKKWVRIKKLPDSRVEISFTDTKKTCVLEVAHLTPVDKIARIRAQILHEGYFYSEDLEKKLHHMYRVPRVSR